MVEIRVVSRNVRTLRWASAISKLSVVMEWSSIPSRTQGMFRCRYYGLGVGNPAAVTLFVTQDANKL